MSVARVVVINAPGTLSLGHAIPKNQIAQNVVFVVDVLEFVTVWVVRPKLISGDPQVGESKESLIFDSLGLAGTMAAHSLQITPAQNPIRRTGMLAQPRLNLMSRVLIARRGKLRHIGSASCELANSMHAELSDCSPRPD